MVVASRRPSPPEPGDEGPLRPAAGPLAGVPNGDPLAGAPVGDPLAGALAGDEESFRALYRLVHPGLLRYLRVLVGTDADDVASETWLQVCRDLPSFTGDLAGFRAWCATVGRHRALDHLRRTRRRPETVALDLDLADRADTAAEATDAIDTERALALIATLPRDQAEAVLLRVVVGLDAAGAGQVLGKRAGAVRMAAFRGLRRLAETLERRHG
ncbi:RNA polymerase sigma factor [Asanoa siamensis]|uniref:RNA polymerase sigma24 factor n=1 Tax=Asanoa siamensis TaxID=926357 RepID=A0ABQ4CUN9_9ACTN|nr:RNA polymerase sigma factor [Asanoa siamensis]GIF74996.1 RNA polymerase sigma24 factor [Asanoa siamensis]